MLAGSHHDGQTLPAFAASRAFEYSWHVVFGEPWVCPLTNSSQLFNMSLSKPGELPPLAFGLHSG